jgi:hypothetical protein
MCGIYIINFYHCSEFVQFDTVCANNDYTELAHESRIYGIAWRENISENKIGRLGRNKNMKKEEKNIEEFDMVNEADSVCITTIVHIVALNVLLWMCCSVYVTVDVRFLIFRDMFAHLKSHMHMHLQCVHNK